MGFGKLAKIKEESLFSKICGRKPKAPCYGASGLMAY